MSNNVEIHNLDYRFTRDEMVLSDLNLTVESGSIYGFLGPNGAGKTTTLRLLLGLLKKQKGSISVFGKSFEDNRVETLRKIGSLVESPSLYGHLTALENLSVLQTVYQCPKSRMTEALALVGLSDTGRKKAGQFSLGMKQRLSIAIALLHKPSLLVLDEPTNGLDPNGIIEIRELLRRLSEEQGLTIIISSHLLPEIEKLVTHLGIINKGRMMFQGTMQELKSRQQQSLAVVFETSDNEMAMQMLREHALTPMLTSGKIALPAVAKEQIARINRQLVDSGIEVYEISTVKNDLEAIFIDMVSR